MNNEISLCKDADNGLVTIGVGQSYATVSIGEWSGILAQPRMYRSASDAALARVQPFGVDFSQGERYHAPDKDAS